MLYFDWLSPRHFGSIRQQIWAFLHFPFHLSLVLFMEGTAQFIIWQKLVEIIDSLGLNITEATAPFFNSETGIFNGKYVELAEALNSTVVQPFIAIFPPTYSSTYIDFDATIEGLASLTTADGSSGIEAGGSRLGAILVNSLFTTYGIVAPKDKTGNADVSDEALKQQDVFTLVVSSICSLLLPIHYPSPRNHIC